MKEHRKKPQDKPILPIKPEHNNAPVKDLNKPFDKSNYNDRKNPKGGCGC